MFRQRNEICDNRNLSVKKDKLVSLCFYVRLVSIYTLCSFFLSLTKNLTLNAVKLASNLPTILGKSVRNCWQDINDNRRIPHNLMSTNPVGQVQKNILYYIMDPVPEGNHFNNIIRIRVKT